MYIHGTHMKRQVYVYTFPGSRDKVERKFHFEIDKRVMSHMNESCHT